MFKIFNLCLRVVKSVFGKESKETVGTREEELNKLLQASIVKKDLRNFKWALEQMDRKPSAKEILAFIGDYSEFEGNILRVLEMSSEEKIPEEDLDRMINYYIDRKSNNYLLFEKLAYMGASQKACRSLSKYYNQSVDFFLFLDADLKE